MLNFLQHSLNTKINWRHLLYKSVGISSLVLLTACSSTPRPSAPIRHVNIHTGQVVNSNAQDEDSMTAQDVAPTERTWQPVSDSSNSYTTTRQVSRVQSTTSSYIVKPGETLYSIAVAHGTTYQELAKLNNISAPYQLLVGETLKVPVNVSSNENTRNVDSQSIADRNYNNIPKGNYSGDQYTVKAGDTLYYIAWISDTSYQELAALNRIAAPYELRVGEVLQLPKQEASNNMGTVSKTQVVSTTEKRSSTTTTAKVAAPVTPTASTTETASRAVTEKPVVSSVTTNTPPEQNNSNVAKQSQNSSNIRWQWPTQGSVIQTFTNSSNDSKGIDISGKKGQPIYAAATGRVVYAGDALKGYGNLIIIKHNDDYLTAYAHNDKILVKEGQDVKLGQEIATMGNSGTNQVKLHFEIRYKGKAVDPQNYLPAQ